MKRNIIDLSTKISFAKLILKGLIKGVHRFFAQPIPIALVVQMKKGGPVHFVDPYDFIAEKENEIMDYIESQRIDVNPFPEWITYQEEVLLDEPLPHNALWFAKPTLDKVSNEIIQQWLRSAQDMFCVDFANRRDTVNREARWAIEHFERYVIRNIIENRGIDLPIGPILQHLVDISGALEEGERATGSLVYIQDEDIDKCEYIAKLAVNPPLKAIKLSRKLLTITQPGTALLSDGGVLLGVIKDNNLPGLRVTFREGLGQLKCGDESICRFKDRTLISNALKIDLSALESVLEKRKVSPEQKKAMLHFVRSIVEHARRTMHGCTLVLDFRKEIKPLTPVGQNITEPLNLTDASGIELACQMAQVDGALHIDLKPSLHAFSCILPYRFDDEVKHASAARGARFNSALCFSHNEPETVTLVVSEDGPMSVFEKGHVLNHVNEPNEIEDREVMPASSVSR
ncbi:MAG TPA: diadenylate cyclase [Trichormus sp.]|jgi:DNA integrity scanning protein DisA with diadenylate cyclase activity